MRDFDLIVAVDEKRGIGKDGDLPWNIPGDMAHFVSQTKTAPVGRRNAVIMGRVNWESIPDKYRPFSDRYNVVMTTQPDYPLPEGVRRAASFDEAIAELPVDIDRVYVIGGGKVFAAAIELPACRRLYLTQIHADFECDTFFPDWNDRFDHVNSFARGEENGTYYDIELWERAR